MAKKKKKKARLTSWAEIRAREPVDERAVSAYDRLMEAETLLYELWEQRGTGTSWIGEALGFPVEADGLLWVAGLGEKVAALGGHLELVAVFPEESRLRGTGSRVVAGGRAPLPPRLRTVAGARACRSGVPRVHRSHLETEPPRSRLTGRDRRWGAAVSSLLFLVSGARRVGSAQSDAGGVARWSSTPRARRIAQVGQPPRGLCRRDIGGACQSRPQYEQRHHSRRAEPGLIA